MTKRFQAGVALVEFAIVLPLLMLLLIGIIETGRFAYYSVLVANAARAGVQYGSMYSADFTGMANAALADGQNLSGLSVQSATNYCYCWDGSSAAPANPQSPCSTIITCPAGSQRLLYVKVTVSGSFSSLFRYPGLPATFTLTRTAVMQSTSTV